MLVDGVDVCGEPVEDASEGSGLKQPGGGGGDIQESDLHLTSQRHEGKCGVSLVGVKDSRWSAE